MLRIGEAIAFGTASGSSLKRWHVARNAQLRWLTPFSGFAGTDPAFRSPGIASNCCGFGHRMDTEGVTGRSPQARAADTVETWSTATRPSTSSWMKLAVRSSVSRR